MQEREEVFHFYLAKRLSIYLQVSVAQKLLSLMIITQVLGHPVYLFRKSFKLIARQKSGTMYGESLILNSKLSNSKIYRNEDY